MQMQMQQQYSFNNGSPLSNFQDYGGINKKQWRKKEDELTYASTRATSIHSV